MDSKSFLAITKSGTRHEVDLKKDISYEYEIIRNINIDYSGYVAVRYSLRIIPKTPVITSLRIECYTFSSNPIEIPNKECIKRLHRNLFDYPDGSKTLLILIKTDLSELETKINKVHTEFMKMIKEILLRKIGS